MEEKDEQEKDEEMPPMRVSRLGAIICDSCKKEIPEDEKRRNNGLCDECKRKGISSEQIFK